MFEVLIGFDERVLDVGDSYSSLHFHVRDWLNDRFPGDWELNISQTHKSYVLLFAQEQQAVLFTLTWL